MQCAGDLRARGPTADPDPLPEPTPSRHTASLFHGQARLAARRPGRRAEKELVRSDKPRQHAWRGSARIAWQGGPLGSSKSASAGLPERQRPWGAACRGRGGGAAPRRLGERAERELGLRREEPERAVEAGRDARQDDARVALEALRAAVHERLDGGQVRLALRVKLCGCARAGLAPAGRARDSPPGTLGFSGLHTGRTYAVQFRITAGAGAQPPPCNLPYLRGRRAGLGAHPGSCRRPGS